MLKVAMIGDSTSVSGFRPLGFAVFAIEHPEEARDVFPRLLGGDYAVVFVTEPVHEALAEMAIEAADRAIPAVTVIPSVGSAGGVGGEKIERAIERALGTKMPMGEEDA